MEACPDDEPRPDRVSGSTCDLAPAKLILGTVQRTSDGTTTTLTTTSSYIDIREGIKSYKFGSDLADAELEWIVEEVNDTINKVNSLTAA